MSEPLLTKRLHISGLTPSITPADLERRLSSFGTVKAMDDFGARDALGDPKKFGFVTIEIGAKDLAKCLNVLSGSTWKGAKLRIGEAKPDFRERIAKINSLPSQPIRPSRTRTRNYGYPSSTLPLTPLSAAAAASTPGWTVTPSGRVVRPMRMRPERPLEPMRTELGASKVKTVNGKVRKRTQPSPARARRRLIDPTKWDSTYLKGVFLDTFSPSFPPSQGALEPPSLVKRDVVDEEGEEETERESTDADASSSVTRRGIESSQPVPQLVQDRALASLATSSRIHEATEPIDVDEEANAALAMLGEMFGDKDEWDGRESVDEMEDLEDIEVRGEEMQVDEEEFEIVPRDFTEGEGSKVTKEGKGKDKEKSLGEVRFGREDGVGVEAARDTDVEMGDLPASMEASAQIVEPAPPRTNLKALFAPREEANFSLLDHLDLDTDFELDADILGIGAPPQNGHPSEPILSTTHIVQVPATVSATKARSRVTLDFSLPLLFPSLDALPHSYTHSSGPTTTIHRYDTPACYSFPSAARVRGLHFLPSSITFTRSPQDTPESIREMWEKDKSSLTRQWKKAWREARGSRRRVEAAGEAGGGY